MTAKTLVTDARAALAADAGTQVRLVARRVSRFLERRMRASDLTLAQFGLMAQIAAARDDTVGALARRMDLDQSTLSRNLRGLERAGLVEVALVEVDLRRRAVWLTESGARRLEAALPVWRAAEADLAARLDLEALQRLTAASEDLTDAVV
ncbi:MAG: hypothetical protein Kilf2KO_00390 [Rhodospirillales bacterium]